MRVLDRLWTRQLALVDLGHYLRGSTCPLAFSQLLSSSISVPVVHFPLSLSFIISYLSFPYATHLLIPSTTFLPFPLPYPLNPASVWRSSTVNSSSMSGCNPVRKKAFCELDHQKVILSNVWELLADIILCLSYSLQSFLHCCSSSLLYLLLSFLFVPFSIRHHHIQE